MSFVPYVMTPNGPRVIYPIEKIIDKKEITTDVTSGEELEKEIIKYIDDRFNKIQERIRLMKIPQGSFDVNSFAQNLKRQIKEDISQYLCSDCIKEGTYQNTKQQLETLINGKFNELAEQLKATVQQIETETDTETK